MTYCHDDIRGIIEKYPRHYDRVLKKQHPTIEKDLSKFGGDSFRESLFRYMHSNTTGIGICRTCGKNTTFVNMSVGYRDFCCTSCHSSHPDTIDQKKKTYLEKYGVDNPAKDPETRQKIRKTNLKRYGVEIASQHHDIIDKQRAKYHKKTLAEKNEIKRKRSETLAQRYGYNNATYVGLSIPAGVVELLNDYDFLYDIHITQKKSLTEISEHLGLGWIQPITNALKRHNIETNYYVSGSSKEERKIRDFLKNKGLEVVTNTRTIIKPKELDIYLPDHDLAIEVNGLYWHSESNGASKSYHLDKTERCRKKGIKLLHFWDYEIRHKPDIVLSIIKANIGVNQRIYARKCMVDTQCNPSRFLKDNHIQGNCPSSVFYNLTYNGEIVASMTLGKPRFGAGDWELIRYANKLDTSVVGGASRLFSRAIKEHNIKNIVSYSDRRLFNGNMYNMLGFKYSHTSRPGYFYTHKYSTMENRMKYQKHKLKTKLTQYNPDLTEWQNMQINGYDRVWDCGNDVWVWSNQ